jgi:hypothetical protein
MLKVDFRKRQTPSMSRMAILVLSLITVFGNSAFAQKSTIEPMRIASGTILSFHLQTRLNSSGGALDILPRGTTLLVKIQDSIDSNVNRDGSEFHGIIVSSVISGSEIVIHPEAQVRVLLALLRSRSHPDGFRYELLITAVTDHGKTIAITASLNPSFSDVPGRPDPLSLEIKERFRANEIQALPANP